MAKDIRLLRLPRLIATALRTDDEIAEIGKGNNITQISISTFRLGEILTS